MSGLMSFFGNQWVVIPGVGLASFILAYVNAERIVSFLWKQSLGSRDYVAARLKIMFVEVDEKKLTYAMLAGSFGLGALAFIVLLPKVIPGLIMAVALTFVGWKAPKFFVDSIYRRRAAEFTDQLVDGLALMASALRAGQSVPQAMKTVSDNMRGPLSQEFKAMLAQNAYGASIEEVFIDLGKRISTPEVQMFTVSVNLLSSTGGNLAETFDTIVKTIRERVRVEKKIEAVTAQGVMQGTIVSAMPFVMIGIMFMVDPPWIMPLFNTTFGLILLFIMLTLQIIGGLMIRKIVKIKV